MRRAESGIAASMLANKVQSFLANSNLANSSAAATIGTASDVPSNVDGEPEAPLSGAVELFGTDANGNIAISPNDIDQQGLGDCYLMSSMGELAKTPEGQKLLQNMIQPNYDSNGNVTSYTVTLHAKNSGLFGTGLFASGYHDVKVTVAPDFPDGDGGWDHAGATTDPNNGKSIIWPMIIEKAYAQFKGGYNKMDNGGDPASALSALTGRDAKDYSVQGGWLGIGASQPSVNDLKNDLSKDDAVVISTRDNIGEGQDQNYDLYANHAYMLMGVTTDASGNSFVILKNPWGDDDPKPIPYDQFKRLFDNVDLTSLT
jgi:hypothetical protein